MKLAWMEILESLYRDGDSPVFSFDVFGAGTAIRNTKLVGVYAPSQFNVWVRTPQSDDIVRLS